MILQHFAKSIKKDWHIINKRSFLFAEWLAAILVLIPLILLVEAWEQINYLRRRQSK